MSAFTPALRYARYESRLRRVVLAMFMKTNSVRCSMDFAMAWHTLELKSSKNWSSSTADESLARVFPFDSTHTAFN